MNLIGAIVCVSISLAPSSVGQMTLPLNPYLSVDTSEYGDFNDTFDGNYDDDDYRYETSGVDNADESYSTPYYEENKHAGASAGHKDLTSYDTSSTATANFLIDSTTAKNFHETSTSLYGESTSTTSESGEAEGTYISILARIYLRGKK